MNDTNRVPLYRRRIVITRPRVRASEWVRRFAASGADVIPFPTFELVLPGSDECERIVATLREFASLGDAWLAVTSPTAAESLLNLVERQARDRSWIDRFRVAAVGEATRKILFDRGLEVSITSGRSNARELASALIDAGVGAGSGVLHVSSSRGRPELIELLQGRGARAEPLHVAHQRPIDGVTTAVLERELAGEGIDMVAFASPSAAEHLLEIAPAAFAARIRTIPALAVGPTTADALTDLGFETITISSQPDVDSVLQTAISFFEPNEP